MKKTFFLFCASVFLISGNLLAQDCLTSECHTDFKTLKLLHTPVEDDCTTCHTKTGDHKFSMQDKTALCIGCHDNKKEGENVHKAVSSGDCGDCHNPHGGNDRSFIKTERMDSLCFKCHDQEPMTKKYVHGPMATGNCAICHNPHSSNYSDLLKTPKERICTRCHTDKEYSGKDMHKHTPLEEGCAGCHDSHSSDFQYELITPAEDLCGECHAELMEKAQKSKFKHAIVEQEKKCANCHDPHGSLFEHNLKRDPLNLCLDCHNKPIIGTDGKDYNIYKILNNNPQKHGPVTDGNCCGCHNPHGAEYYKILIQDYPEKFYIPFEQKKYNLCFACHENTLVRDERTTTLTNFRDGDINLHYLHINREKGRTCRACHEIHAAELPNHIRKETPFGEWSIPIGFSKSETGGNCIPGCHKAYTYDRKKSNN